MLTTQKTTKLRITGRLVEGIPRWISPYKEPVMRKEFPWHDATMASAPAEHQTLSVSSQDNLCHTGPRGYPIICPIRQKNTTGATQTSCSWRLKENRRNGDSFFNSNGSCFECTNEKEKEIQLGLRHYNNPLSAKFPFTAITVARCSSQWYTTSHSIPHDQLKWQSNSRSNQGI